MSRLLVILIALAACLAPWRAEAECSALTSPTRDKCLRLELDLAASAAREAYQTLRSRLDGAARAELEREDRSWQQDMRPCLALQRVSRRYKPREKTTASGCIADMQDRTSGLLEWLVAIELPRTDSGIAPPRAGWGPSDYQLLARYGGRFLLVIWSADPGNVCAESMLSVMRRGSGPAAWEPAGAARPIGIECPRFGGLLTPDRPVYPDAAITGEAERRSAPMTRYFKLTRAGIAPFAIDPAYVGNDSPQISAVPKGEDPIVFVWASEADGSRPCPACLVQIPLFYRLRAGKLFEACGEQRDAYEDIIRAASEDRRSALAAVFAQIQLGRIDAALARLRDAFGGEAAKLADEIRSAWPDAQAHDCRLAGLWAASAHRATTGLAD